MTEIRWPHVALCLAMAGSVGCGVGYWLGTHSSAQATVPQMHEARDSREEIELLRGLDGRLAHVEAALATGYSGGPSRQLATDPRSDARDSQSALSELQATMDLVLKRLAEMGSRSAIVESESLRIARLQNPQPKLVAAEALGRELRLASDQTERYAVARKWWMMAMDAVIVELGLPTNIIADRKVAGRQMWEYMRPDGESVVILTFQNGLVVEVWG